jgi:hypothetical protein
LTEGRTFNVKVLLFPAICGLILGISSSVLAGEPLLSLAEDLEHITGKTIELHASPGAYEDRSLPLICEILASAFREVAMDSATRSLLNRTVRSVVIEEFYAANDTPHVVLLNEVLTVQSLNSDEAARSLRPLILQALKHAAVKLQ